MNEEFIVLIVDDSKIICERIRSLLNEIPRTTQVFSAYTYEEGLQLAKSCKPQVAIIDINLPDKNGIELLRNIKEGKDAVKIVIMMSEDASEIERKKCAELGADYFLNKFSDFEKIGDIIENMN